MRMRYEPTQWGGHEDVNMKRGVYEPTQWDTVSPATQTPTATMTKNKQG